MYMSNGWLEFKMKVIVIFMLAAMHISIKKVESFRNNNNNIWFETVEHFHFLNISDLQIVEVPKSSIFNFLTYLISTIQHELSSVSMNQK
jgi:hypothetical protein